MPKLIACMAGLVALIAGIFGNVEPVLCLQRSMVAMVVGWCIGAFWQAASAPTIVVHGSIQPEKGDGSMESEKAA